MYLQSQSSIFQPYIYFILAFFVLRIALFARPSASLCSTFALELNIQSWFTRCLVSFTCARPSRVGSVRAPPLTFSCRRSIMAARKACRFSSICSIFSWSFSSARRLKLLFSSMAFSSTSRSCSRFSARIRRICASWDWRRRRTMRAMVQEQKWRLRRWFVELHLVQWLMCLHHKTTVSEGIHRKVKKTGQETNHDVRNNQYFSYIDGYGVLKKYLKVWDMMKMHLFTYKKSQRDWKRVVCSTHHHVYFTGQSFDSNFHFVSGELSQVLCLHWVRTRIQYVENYRS